MPTSAMVAAIDRSMPPVIRASIWTSAIIARMPPSVISVSRLAADRNTGARTVTTTPITARMAISTASRRCSGLRTRALRARRGDPGRGGDDVPGIELPPLQGLDDPALAHHHRAVRDAQQLGQLRG